MADLLRDYDSQTVEQIRLLQFSLPRNQISARAVLMSGVFTRTRGKISPHNQLVKIPVIRIELRSKRIPGKREDGLLQRQTVNG
jgi:hypothetical protein